MNRAPQSSQSLPSSHVANCELIPPSRPPSPPRVSPPSSQNPLLAVSHVFEHAMGGGGFGSGEAGGEAGGGGDGGQTVRRPQSAQSWPIVHPVPVEPSSPSSHTPSLAYAQSLKHQAGGGAKGSGGTSGDGGGCNGGDGGSGSDGMWGFLCQPWHDGPRGRTLPWPRPSLAALCSLTPCRPRRRRSASPRSMTQTTDHAPSQPA